MSKRADAPYRSGPSKTWLKSKNPASEAVRLGARLLKPLKNSVWGQQFRLHSSIVVETLTCPAGTMSSLPATGVPARMKDARKAKSEYCVGPFRDRPLLADTVEKVENRTTPKISQMLIFGQLYRWDAP